MTASREPDRLIQAFLEEGPDVLPDRVLEAVWDDAHRHPRRTRIGPWRNSTMRILLASAAVAAIIIAGAGVYFASRVAAPPTGTDEPTSSPSLAALPEPKGILNPGATYDSGSFTHSFAFTVPATAAGLSEDMWDGFHTFRLRPALGGAITIHDGRGLPNDLCQTTGVLRDLPDVEQWLTANEKLTVSPTEQLTNSKLSVRYWDIELGSDCHVAGDLPAGLAISFSVGEHHRLYEVEVGTDTVLVMTWGAGYGGEGDEVLDQLNPLTDELVRSIAGPVSE